MHPVTDVLDCEPVPSSVRSARLFVVDKLQAWRCDDLVDGVALLTSELATNAVIHTGRPYKVGVQKDGDRIRVEVIDLDSAPPKPFVDGDDRGLFHGLNVVESLATAWGSDARPGGKVVWFELEGAECNRDDPDSLASLRDLRSTEDTDAGYAAAWEGKETSHDQPHQEVGEMAKQDVLIDERDRLQAAPKSRAIWKLLLVLLILAGAVVAFFALGGDADVDVNAPDVDISTEEAPPADADAEG